VDGMVMRDYLKELCDNVNINLIYTSNKLIVLSPIINNNVPSIRAHKLFKNCTDEVAKAIISYYSGIDSKGEAFRIIESYVQKNFDSSKFKITSSNDEFKSYFSKAVMSAEPVIKNDDPYLMELEINKIRKVDFWGESMGIASNGSISTSGSEMIELDIEVNGIE
jgi:hypothetical protein